jgi:hypothetical protein
MDEPAGMPIVRFQIVGTDVEVVWPECPPMPPEPRQGEETATVLVDDILEEVPSYALSVARAWPEGTPLRS